MFRYVLLHFVTFRYVTFSFVTVRYGTFRYVLLMRMASYVARAFTSLLTNFHKVHFSRTRGCMYSPARCACPLGDLFPN